LLEEPDQTRAHAYRTGQDEGVGQRASRVVDSPLDMYEPMTDRTKVLVVDDESSIAELLGDLLESAGYRVLLASNGRTALAMARREHPALVLTDQMMPEIDGVEFVRRLRSSPVTSDIPVVLMSSNKPGLEAARSTPVAARQTGYARSMVLRGVEYFLVDNIWVPFVAKPFDIEDILQVVETTAGSVPLTANRG
jgi:CheY-like chemotaxis protein